MLKRQIIFLGVWIALWSGFAADQLLITYEHLQPKSIYGDKVIVERNGTKFLVEKDRVTNNKFETDYTCGDEDLWKNNFIHNFNFETSTLEIEYIGYKN